MSVEHATHPQPRKGENSRPRRTKAARKVIVAATGTWEGELYLSQAAAGRYPFSGREEFCAAIAAATGWYSARSTGPGAPLPRNPHPQQAAAVVGKFIIAADAPWRGTVYRTTRGGRRGFLCFEELLARGAAAMGWPTHSRHR